MLKVHSHESGEPMEFRNRGQLRNGNPGGDFTRAPRCGARNRQGKPCMRPTLRKKDRCALHGGKSLGAATPEGRQKLRAIHWKNGARSQRLQAEGKKLARRREQEILMTLLSEMTAESVQARQLAGVPVLPQIKVRVRVTAPEPPEEWGRAGGNE